MPKRTRTSQTKTSKRAYSDALLTLGKQEQKFLQVAMAAGTNGVHYEEVMEATGMGQSAAGTVRCNLLEKGLLNFNGQERATTKGRKDAAVVVHVKHSTEADITRTEPWRAERRKKKAAEAALEIFPKLEEQRKEARKTIRQIKRITEHVLNPATSGKDRRARIKEAHALADWLDGFLVRIEE